MERDSDIKHEYYDGEIFDMVGASVSHNLIQQNISRMLGNQLLGGPCKVLLSDMRVKVQNLLQRHIVINSWHFPDRFLHFSGLVP